MRLFPKFVNKISHGFDAWVVGSSADPTNDNPKDYDVLVPFSRWQEACMMIPASAKPNTFGGWKIEEDGASIDVWPGDIGWLMQRPKMKFAYHISSGTHWQKII